MRCWIQFKPLPVQQQGCRLSTLFTPHASSTCTKLEHDVCDGGSYHTLQPQRDVDASLKARAHGQHGLCVNSQLARSGLLAKHRGPASPATYRKMNKTTMRIRVQDASQADWSACAHRWRDSDACEHGQCRTDRGQRIARNRGLLVSASPSIERKRWHTTGTRVADSPVIAKMGSNAARSPCTVKPASRCPCQTSTTLNVHARHKQCLCLTCSM